MEPTLKLPKTIVLAGEAYQHCLSLFESELWDEEQSDRLMEAACEHRDDPYTIDDLRRTEASIRAVLRRPWLKRRQFVAEAWSERRTRLVARRLDARRANAASLQWLRVSTRRLATWLSGDLRPAQEPDRESDALCASLDASVAYFWWVWCGGDADVARLIAIYRLERPKAGR